MIKCLTKKDIIDALKDWPDDVKLAITIEFEHDMLHMEIDGIEAHISDGLKICHIFAGRIKSFEKI